MSQNDVQTKTMVTQAMIARTGMKEHAAGSGPFISVPEARQMLIQSCFSECPNLTKENPFDKTDGIVRKGPVKLYLLVSVHAARNEGTISTHLIVGFRMLPRLAISCRFLDRSWIVAVDFSIWPRLGSQPEHVFAPSVPYDPATDHLRQILRI